GGDAMTRLADEMAFLPAVELGRRLKRRELTSVALTEGYLERIDRLAPRLACFVTLTPEQALAPAREAGAPPDSRKSRGRLHGVPYGVKDTTATGGIRTTWGARPYAERVPKQDATVITRLRGAGAVLLGKLSMIELAGGLGYDECGAALNGACRTPWDL